jgi:hypothetical protein
MSDAIIYAIADRGVSAPRYRRRLSQRDSNNVIEPFRALEIPLFSVAILKKDTLYALPAPLHPNSTLLLALFKMLTTFQNT